MFPPSQIDFDKSFLLEIEMTQIQVNQSYRLKKKKTIHIISSRLYGQSHHIINLYIYTKLSQNYDSMGRFVIL